jgi:alkylation response protein AidB-like acyl-CoA dehydrogenase
MPQHAIVGAVRDLHQLITAHRPEGDRQANLTREVLDACGEAGLFRMAAPREVGGLELLPHEVVAATQTVSRADPAVGWYAINSMAASFLAAFVGEEERHRLFEDPDANFGFAFMPGGRAIPVQGGYRLSGSWPVMTGGRDAKWAAVVGQVMDGDAPRMVGGNPDTREFLIRTEDLQFKNTWQNVSAMRGTGSNACSVEELFVPEGFVVAPGDPPRIDRPYFRAPMLLHIIPADAAVILGILESVLGAIIPALSEQKAAVTGEWRRDQPATQELVVQCTYMFRSAQAVLREVTERASERIERGEEIDARERAEFYAIITQIFEIGRQLASELFAGGTRDAFVRGHPLEQALKDLHAIAYARSATRFIVYSSGRVLLGGEHDPGL